MNVVGNLPLGVVLRDGADGAPALVPNGKIPVFVLGKCRLTGEERRFRLHVPARLMPSQDEMRERVELSLRNIEFIEARPWGDEDAYRVLYPVPFQHTVHDAKRVDTAAPDPKKKSLLISSILRGRPLGGRSLLSKV